MLNPLKPNKISLYEKLFPIAWAVDANLSPGSLYQLYVDVKPITKINDNDRNWIYSVLPILFRYDLFLSIYIMAGMRPKNDIEIGKYNFNTLKLWIIEWFGKSVIWSKHAVKAQAGITNSICLFLKYLYII